LTGESTNVAEVSERLAIAGSGAIACGLAAAARAAGTPVVLVARSGAAAQRARAGIARAGAEEDSVDVATDVGALADATFVVEAIIEDAAAKAALLAEIGAATGPDAVLATTTSSLDVEALAAASGRPERFAAFHVFNPVTKMKLVELAFPREADARTHDRARAVCEALGKTPVEVPAIPGFVVNRLLFPYLFDAVRLLDETAIAPEDLDACMKLGAGYPLGPLALIDLVGVDVAIAIGEALSLEVPERLRALAAEGALGRKAGRGFHAYG
jgi:3-hydroxybutyryl-CoA dehydrogenase